MNRSVLSYPYKELDYNIKLDLLKLMIKLFIRAPSKQDSFVSLIK